jgi:uncharacterized protein DUF4440
MTSMRLAPKGHCGLRRAVFSIQPRKKITMKSFTFFLALTLAAVAVAPCARAQSGSTDTSAVETKLKQMEDSWSKSFMDKDHGVAVVEPMVADDFARVSEEGKIQDKAQLLEEMKKNTDIASASTNDKMDVHVYAPNVATVVGISSEKGKDKNGKAYSRSYGWVDTWMERNGKW